jgi:hypothetical protein
MPDTQSSNIDPSPVEAVHTAHLEKLTKMSTTAGLGSGDYAAVSPIAVTAVFAGLLGGLAFLTEFLLPIPLAAAICGVIALVQIRRSNGTQTGVMLAWAGIILGVGVLAAVIGGHLLKEARERPDREAIARIINEFDQACAKQDYRAAYQLFAPPFRERVSEEEFVRTLSAQGGTIAGLGALQHVGWNQQVIFADSTDDAPKAAVVGGLMKFEHVTEMSPQGMEFGTFNGKWMIRDIPTIFPPKRQ